MIWNIINNINHPSWIFTIRTRQTRTLLAVVVAINVQKIYFIAEFFLIFLLVVVQIMTIVVATILIVIGVGARCKNAINGLIYQKHYGGIA